MTSVHALAPMETSPAIGSYVILGLPLLLLLWLMLTQRRRGRAVAELQQSLSIGDLVVTTSGMHGRIAALDDRVAMVEVAPGVTVRFERRAIGAQAPERGSGPIDTIAGGDD